jgi:hypothetical protein
MLEINAFLLAKLEEKEKEIDRLCPYLAKYTVAQELLDEARSRVERRDKTIEVLKDTIRRNKDGGQAGGRADIYDG